MDTLVYDAVSFDEAISEFLASIPELWNEPEIYNYYEDMGIWLAQSRNAPLPLCHMCGGSLTYRRGECYSCCRRQTKQDEPIVIDRNITIDKTNEEILFLAFDCFMQCNTSRLTPTALADYITQYTSNFDHYKTSARPQAVAKLIRSFGIPSKRIKGKPSFKRSDILAHKAFQNYRSVNVTYKMD